MRREPNEGGSGLRRESSPSRVAILVLTTFRLGMRDVCSGNEAVEAVFVQQMVDAREIPVPDGERQRADVQAAAVPLDRHHDRSRAIGARKVTAFNVRLPSVLYAAAGAILTMLFAYEILGLEGAILAGADACRLVSVHHAGPLRPRGI